MARLAIVVFLALAVIPIQASGKDGFRSSVRPLPVELRAQLDGRFWHPGCPVGFSQLRLLTVTHWDFDGRTQTGQLIVNRSAAVPLEGVFRQLYAQRFPIRHMQLADMYGPASSRPPDNDITGAFHCRKAVPSPCGTGSGNWSNHAYGYAIDLNPRENPYVGCGMAHDPASLRFADRTPLRRGMVTPAVVRAFRSIGWGWGGGWTGNTQDYMHFSVNGH